jgi:hypothetical protein
MRPGKGSFRGVACSPEAKPDRSGAAARTLDPNQRKPLQREVVRPYLGVEMGEPKKEISDKRTYRTEEEDQEI